MIVIKRSGKEQEFDLDKLVSSVISASDEIKKPLNSSDIYQLAKNVKEILSGKEKVSSKQIFTVLVGALYVEGFHDIAESYLKSRKNTWR